MLARLAFTVWRAIGAIPEPLRSALVRALPGWLRARAASFFEILESTEEAIRLIPQPYRALVRQAMEEHFQIPEVRVFAKVGFRAIRLPFEGYPYVVPLPHAFLEFRVVVYDLDRNVIYRLGFRFSYGESVDRETFLRRLLHLLSKTPGVAGYRHARQIISRAVVLVDSYLVGRFQVE